MRSLLRLQGFLQLAGVQHLLQAAIRVKHGAGRGRAGMPDLDTLGSSRVANVFEEQAGSLSAVAFLTCRAATLSDGEATGLVHLQ